jgi:antitoxin ParD1/3/4
MEIAMTTLDLSLTPELQTFVETEAEHAGYASPAKYVEAVLLEVWKRSAQGELENQIQAGLESGPAFEVTPQFWQSLKDRLRQRHAAGQTP